MRESASKEKVALLPLEMVLPFVLLTSLFALYGYRTWKVRHLRSEACAAVLA